MCVGVGRGYFLRIGRCVCVREVGVISESACGDVYGKGMNIFACCEGVSVRRSGVSVYGCWEVRKGEGGVTFSVGCVCVWEVVSDGCVCLGAGFVRNLKRREKRNRQCIYMCVCTKIQA